MSRDARRSSRSPACERGTHADRKPAVPRWRVGLWGVLVRCVLLAAVVAWGVLTVAYAVRPDPLAALTVLPHWPWVIPGLLSAMIAGRLRRKRAAVALALLWAAFGVAFVDAPLALVRPIFAGPADAGGLRVVSLNCAGSAGAVRGLAALRPDVVLLQESPGRDVVDRLAADLFGDDGGAVWGPDCSVLARGTVSGVPRPEDRRGDHVHAVVRLDDGRPVHVVSLRLQPSPARIDLWNPACWTFRYRERKARRARLAEIVAVVSAAAGDAPLLLGGDFNCPSGDGALSSLTHSDRGFRDAFAAAGRGWGHTFLAGMPLLRIDQIWCDRGFVPRSAGAVRVDGSDHRAVTAVMSRTAPP